jgi:hypothetical protein
MYASIKELSRRRRRRAVRYVLRARGDAGKGVHAAGICRDWNDETLLWRLKRAAIACELYACQAPVIMSSALSHAAWNSSFSLWCGVFPCVHTTSQGPPICNVTKAPATQRDECSTQRDESSIIQKETALILHPARIEP